MAEKDMAQKIKDLRAARGMTLEQVAGIVGVGKSTVRKWETGMIANMRRDKIAVLAQALGTTPEYLMGWDHSIEVSNIYRIETKRFPVLGNIACGEPILADEHIELYIEAGTNIQADFVLRAKGDSMIGARIQDGDFVFIRQQDAVVDGEIAAVLIDDEATLKRVYYDKEAGVLTLCAENPAYKIMRYSGEDLDRIRILGKAIAFQSDIR